MTRRTPLALALAGWFAAGCAGELPVEEDLAAVEADVRAGRAVFVGFRVGSSGSAADILDQGGQVEEAFEDIGAAVAKLPLSALRALSRHPAVEYIEVDRPVKAFFGSPPPPTGITLAPSTGHSTAGSAAEYTWGLDAVQAPAVWDLNRDGVLDARARVGSGVKVCVIDSGIDPLHPELKVPFQGGYDFVDGDNDPTDQTGSVKGEGHGTHVAGTIAAQLASGGEPLPGGDPNGVVGVAPGVSLYAVRVLGVDGKGDSRNMISGLRWCQRHQMHIATLSLGGQEAFRTERRAFDAAYAAGMLIFAAAGNDGNEVPIAYPAGYASVISVGAVDASLALADFTQTGAEAELSAPGVDVLSSVPRQQTLLSHLAVARAPVLSNPLEFTGRAGVHAPMVDCGLGDSATSCVNKPDGAFVAYVDRGVVTFTDKAKNVVAQGALGLIVGNNDQAAPDEPGRFTLGVAGSWPAAVSVSLNAAQALKQQFGRWARIGLTQHDYDRWPGTSMACPHAAAVGALVWGARPGLTNVEVRRVLRRSAKDLGPSGWDRSFGYGLVQAKAALATP